MTAESEAQTQLDWVEKELAYVTELEDHVREMVRDLRVRESALRAVLGLPQLSHDGAEVT